MINLFFLQYLRFVRLRVQFEALETIVLPEYKGSAFRGCIGESLRDEVCKYSGLDCQKCGERYSCPFSQLFNSFVEPAHPHHGKYPKCPHPYIIDPGNDRRTVLNPGDSFGFDITLVGNAEARLPLLLRVFELMGGTGIGKGHARFRATGLLSMRPDTRYVPVLLFGQPDRISLNGLPTPVIGNTVTLKLETPLRMKGKGRLLHSPPAFGLFAERLAQRLGLLAHFHCGAPWLGEDARFSEGAETIHICRADVQMADWRRYSGTQDTRMNFDGLTGSITYEGEGLNRWVPLLAMGVWLHAGSTATFGLGKYRIDG
ncbi:MAG: CRISPR system precrRNA processing endoribonuclease RAMP protein Cas6 [Prolixibacteraceae bacterium]|jgi:hypothetical protein|nr:CRISPR system precrRNA processing endoribonuclease RAMP protein Cas6 [Prolixibacteraceae bacterium]